MNKASIEDIGSAFQDILDGAQIYARSESVKSTDIYNKMDRQGQSRIAAMLRRDASAANDERNGVGGATPETTAKLRAENTLANLVRNGHLTQSQLTAANHIEALL